MGSTGTSLDWALCDIVVPRAPDRLPGIEMAGFSLRAVVPLGISMVAHPAVTLLFDLSEAGDGLVCDSRGRSGRGSVVIGLLPGEVRASGQVGDCLQIRLEPAVAAVMFGPSGLPTGTVTSLEELWGTGAERVRERLRAAGSWEERFALARAFVGPRLGARRPVDPEVAHIWQRTRTSCGRLRVEGLADEVGWSRKRLSARFQAQLGIAPKRAARLMRFDHAVHLLAAGRAAAEVAAECGYADQSHLHREVREFSGLTPVGVAAAPWLAIDEIAWPAASAVRRRGSFADRRTLHGPPALLSP